MFQLPSVIAVVRENSADDALRIGRALIDAGVPAVEITLTTPDAFQVIAKLADVRGESVIGAGTVMTLDDARTSSDSGATFLVSPVLVENVLSYAIDHKLGAIPGALTPSEVHKAEQAGADAVKVFPAVSLGGPEYIRHLRGPFPTVPITISGGVTDDTAALYLRAGANSICIGRALVSSESLKARDHEGLVAHARSVMMRLGV